VKTRLLVMVSVLVSSAVLGCTSGPESSAASKTIQVTMDDLLKQSATPFHWTADAKIGDPAILQQTSHDYVRPDSAAMGAPGAEVWMFTARVTVAVMRRDAWWANVWLCSASSATGLS
jgi:inhibitor of cysteine peptidase